MAFTLEVEFSGLCLYVLHRADPSLVAVLLPDCRQTAHASPIKHIDGRDAKPHVGYVRFDMEQLKLVSKVAAAATEPRYELVHRFARQVLKFEGTLAGATEINADNLFFPRLDCLGFPLDLVPNLFATDDAVVPKALLARMILDGGTLQAKRNEDSWYLPQLCASGASKPTYVAKYASEAKWKRAFGGDTLTVRITDFADKDESKFVVEGIADGSSLTVKVANLCCQNPLEWEDLPSRRVNNADDDFKWLYTLLQPTGTDYPNLLGGIGAGAELPHPILVAAGSAETGSDDCIAGIKTAEFP